MTVMEVLTADDPEQLKRVIDSEVEQFYQDLTVVLADTPKVGLPLGEGQTTHDPLAIIRRDTFASPEIVVNPKNLQLTNRIGHRVVYMFGRDDAGEITYGKNHIRISPEGTEEVIRPMDITREDYAILGMVFAATAKRKNELS